MNFNLVKAVQKEVDGFKWELDITDNGIGRVLFAANSSGKDYDFAREKIFMNILDTTVKSGMTCIDLGANIGYATMFMLRNSGPDGTVYAIEPDEHNLKFLRRNLEINGYECETTQALITNRDGKSDFWIASQPNLNSVRKTKHSIRKEQIDCYTLETFCSERKYPNFIKMDIEGHEVKVFESGLDYFDKNKGETHFLLEVHPHFYSKENDFGKILREYIKVGFNIKYIVSTPRPNPAPIKSRGYAPLVKIKSDGWIRSLYTNIGNEDAITFATSLFQGVYDMEGKKIVRSIMVSRK